MILIASQHVDSDSKVMTVSRRKMNYLKLVWRLKKIHDRVERRILGVAIR